MYKRGYPECDYTINNEKKEYKERPNNCVRVKMVISAGKCHPQSPMNSKLNGNSSIELITFTF